MEVATRCWLEIDLAAIEENARAITKRAGPERTWLAVVKADGYGHGAVPAAERALAGGADQLAVAALEEALALRAAGIRREILVLGYCPAEYAPTAGEAGIALTAFGLTTIAAYEAAMPAGKRLRVHLKVDTGMGRMGVLANEAGVAIQALRESERLAATGIYTHFASAAEDDDFTTWQIALFEWVLAQAAAMGVSFSYIHAANSAGSLGGGPQIGNLLRIGIALYGLESTPAAPLGDSFRPALSWKTVIAQVKALPAGHSVGYGRAYFTDSPQRIAILPVGYSDGYRRAPAAAQHVLVCGRKCPVVGRVSMEKTAIRIHEDLAVAPGDEVVLLGKQGNASISAKTLARWFGTINYEVVTAISARVPRRYFN